MLGKPLNNLSPRASMIKRFNRPIVATYKGQTFKNLHKTTVYTLLSYHMRGLIDREETEETIIYKLPEKLP